MKQCLFLIVAACVAVLATSCGGSKSSYDIDSLGVPAIINSNVVELDKIKSISKLRSGAGHDYSDSQENCRSMKHYLLPKAAYQTNGEIKVYAPFDGTITKITDGTGSDSGDLVDKQVHIVPDGYSAFTFRFFHIDPISAEIAVGKKVTEGEHLGHAHVVHDGIAGDFDIALEVSVGGGDWRLISPFEAMTSTVFSAYTARGISSASTLVITKEERNSAPLSCSTDEEGATFVGSGSISGAGSLTNWIDLN